MRNLTGAGVLLASAAVLGLSVACASAQDAFLDEAKAYIETLTAPVTTWGWRPATRTRWWRGWPRSWPAPYRSPSSPSARRTTLWATLTWSVRSSSR